MLLFIFSVVHLNRKYSLNIVRNFFSYLFKQFSFRLSITLQSHTHCTPLLSCFHIDSRVQSIFNRIFLANRLAFNFFINSFAFFSGFWPFFPSFHPTTSHHHYPNPPQIIIWLWVFPRLFGCFFFFPFYFCIIIYHVAQLPTTRAWRLFQQKQNEFTESINRFALTPHTPHTHTDYRHTKSD